jgi:putative copper resistance protein D
LTVLQAGIAACRLGSFASVMVLFGAGFFTSAFAPGALGDFIAQRLRLCIGLAVVVALVSATASLPLGIVAIAGGWREAMQPGTVSTILWETTSGWTTPVRLGLTILLAGFFVASSRPTLGLLILSGLLLASFAFSGHAVMDEGTRDLIHRSNDIVHLIAGAAWLGSLVPLLPCLSALRQPALRKESGLALRRFSIAGHGAVVLVLATGIANAFLVEGFPAGWLSPSPYHILLPIKMTLVATMVGLAIANRYVWVPRLKSRGEAAVRAITRRTIVELVLGAAVLALVALFGLLDPN